MDTLTALTRARAAISTPDTWCQHLRHSASGAHCALGAIEVALGRPDENYFTADRHPATAALAEALPPGKHGSIPVPRGSPYFNAWRVANYNNTHTHAEVLAVFDRSIARASTFARAAAGSTIEGTGEVCMEYPDDRSEELEVLP